MGILLQRKLLYSVCLSVCLAYMSIRGVKMEEPVKESEAATVELSNMIIVHGLSMNTILGDVNYEKYEKPTQTNLANLILKMSKDSEDVQSLVTASSVSSNKALHDAFSVKRANKSKGSLFSSDSKDTVTTWSSLAEIPPEIPLPPYRIATYIKPKADDDPSASDVENDAENPYATDDSDVSDNDVTDRSERGISLLLLLLRHRSFGARYSIIIITSQIVRSEV